VMRLHDKVEHAVVRAGLAPQSRKFTPHVSLARFKNNAGALTQEELLFYLSDNARFRAGPFAADRFTLYSSFLSSSGAIYTPEADYPLVT